MTIFLGADHGGFAAKEELKAQLQNQGYAVKDCGAHRFDDQDDYPIFAGDVAKQVAAAEDGRGILFCRSGHGMVIAANKVKGARAILAVSEDSAVQAKEHDDANVLAFGVDFDQVKALPIALAWLKADFDGGRHARRLQQVQDLEAGL